MELVYKIWQFGEDLLRANSADELGYRILNMQVYAIACPIIVAILLTFASIRLFKRHTALAATQLGLYFLSGLAAIAMTLICYYQ